MMDKHKHPAKEEDKSPLKLVVAQNIVWVVIAVILVLGSFAKDYIYQRWQYTEFTLHSLDKDVQRDMAITDILYKTLEKKQADRCYVFRFHNGGLFAGGVPFKKTSCTHEVVKVGVSREINNLQQIPLSTVPEFAEAIVKNPDVFVLRTSELKRGTFRSILEAEAIRVILCHRLMVNDEVWGFVGVDYLRDLDCSDPKLEPGYGELNNAAHLIELELAKGAL